MASTGRDAEIRADGEGVKDRRLHDASITALTGQCDVVDMSAESCAHRG